MRSNFRFKVFIRGPVFVHAYGYSTLLGLNGKFNFAIFKGLFGYSTRILA